MTRVISAVVLLAVIGITIWLLPVWATIALAAVVAALGAGEVALLAGRTGASVPPIFVGLSAAAVAVAFAFYDRLTPQGVDDTLGAVLLTLLVITGVVSLAVGPPGPHTVARAGVLMMAPLYVGLPLGALAWVQWLAGPAATSWLVVTIAASDSAQYYTGRMFGRRKLAPAVSPAKTVEGAIGGLVFATVVGALLGPMCVAGVTAPIGALMGLALATFGIVGDLFESSLKRGAGAKDSSSIIPGHGGVLDRIDAYLFATPVFYLCLRYVV
jgi:phosphatidate cytidylyltransferase